MNADVPPVPADMQLCPREAVTVPGRDLTDAEVERLWKTDRASLALLNGCFLRLLCQYADVRREIAKIDDALCEEGSEMRNRISRSAAPAINLRGTLR
jgi:hypothetical protein